MKYWAILFSLLVYLLFTYVQEQGFISDLCLFFEAKMRLAFEGAPPRFSNIALVGPFLPYSLVLLFRSYALAASFVAGISFYLLSKRGAWLLTLLPAYLSLAFYRLDLSLALLILMLCWESLRHFRDDGGPFQLFLFGSGCFLLTLCHSAASLLVCALLFPLFVAAQERKIPRSVVCVVAIFPWAFSFLSEYVLESIYQPISYWQQVELANAELLAVSWTMKEAFLMWAKELVHYVWLLPALVCLGGGFTAIFLAYPLALIVTGNYVSTLALWLYPVLAGAFLSKNARPWPLVLSSVAACAFIYQDGDIEPIEEFQTPLTGSVLLDDKVHYRYVRDLLNPEKAILPYQALYPFALSNPSAFADFVIVSRTHPQDTLRNSYPEVVGGELSGYSLVELSGSNMLFKRQS